MIHRCGLRRCQGTLPLPWLPSAPTAQISVQLVDSGCVLPRSCLLWIDSGRHTEREEEEGRLWLRSRHLHTPCQDTRTGPHRSSHYTNMGPSMNMCPSMYTRCAGRHGCLCSASSRQPTTPGGRSGGTHAFRCRCRIFRN